MPGPLHRIREVYFGTRNQQVMLKYGLDRIAAIVLVVVFIAFDVVLITSVILNTNVAHPVVISNSTVKDRRIIRTEPTISNLLFVDGPPPDRALTSVESSVWRHVRVLMGLDPPTTIFSDPDDPTLNQSDERSTCSHSTALHIQC